MPGANERALEKAKTLPADALILDLEDAVAPDAKAEARERVVRRRRVRRVRRQEVTIRVNGLGTAVARRRPRGRRRGRARRGRGAQGRLGRRRARQVEARPRGGRRPDRTAIWAMVETPGRHARRRARSPRASERLTVLVMGTNDLAKELHAEHVPGRAAAAAPGSACACSPPAPPAR